MHVGELRVSYDASNMQRRSECLIQHKSSVLESKGHYSTTLDTFVGGSINTRIFLTNFAGKIPVPAINP